VHLQKTPGGEGRKMAQGDNADDELHESAKLTEDACFFRRKRILK
jgi:hypothetical protein